MPGINLNILKMDNYTMDDKKYPIFRGEFEVVKKLVAALPEGEAAKSATDKILDKNGTSKTGGTGVKHLRENIAESKLSYEVMDDSAQVVRLMTPRIMMILVVLILLMIRRITY